MRYMDLISVAALALAGYVAYCLYMMKKPCTCKNEKPRDPLQKEGYVKTNCSMGGKKDMRS